MFNCEINIIFPPTYISQKTVIIRETNFCRSTNTLGIDWLMIKCIDSLVSISSTFFFHFSLFFFLKMRFWHFWIDFAPMHVRPYGWSKFLIRVNSSFSVVSNSNDEKRVRDLSNSYTLKRDSSELQTLNILDQIALKTWF